MNQFLQVARDLAYGEVAQTGMPLKMHVDLSVLKGQEIASKLGANLQIVEAGTLLMDCMIGQAVKAGKIQDHIEMSLAKTNEILSTSGLDMATQENIRHCVLEHHGVSKFYSLESEICCNADCYRFASIKGFTVAMRYLREMPFEDLVTLLGNKFDEKKMAITLSACKDELGQQITTIQDWVTNLKSEAKKE